FQRDMLAEFVRFAFCTAHGLNPAMPQIPDPKASRLRPRKAPWPAVDSEKAICDYVREALKSKLQGIAAATAKAGPVQDSDLILELDFIAFSAETLITLSREICGEIDEVL